MKIVSKIKRKIKTYYILSKYEDKYITEDCSLKYLFIPENNSNKLLVVFSAFPGKNQPARYNYISTINKINCNKLFILDSFGPNISGGSYYLGKNRNFFVEKAVNSLVSKITFKLSITNKDIISVGSSKGGFAALYFGFKNGYGASIAGAPQTLLGNYLSREDHQCYLNYISGGVSSKDKEYLNGLLFEVVNQSNDRPRVFIHVGKEYHYEEHVIPFLNHLKANNIQYDLELKDYTKHSDVGIYFPTYIHNVIKVILSEGK